MNTTRMTTFRSCHRRLALFAVVVLGFVGHLTAFLPLSAQHLAQRQSASTRAEGVVAAPASLAITNATVIDVTTGNRLTGQTIVIVGNRIRELGVASAVHIPRGARVVDAKGLYVIPGLWDMHAHVDNLVDQLYPLFIANGVTALREMAQRFPFGSDSFVVWQRQIMAGTRVGPRVVGPSADLTYQVSIETPQDAIRIVDSLKAAGALFLKVHDDNMDPALYFAVAHEARKIGIPFVGHIPVGVTEVQASDSGQMSVEHVEENHHCWPNWPNPLDSLAEQRCAPVAAAYVRNHTWMVPTLAGADYVDRNVPLAQQFISMMHRHGVKMLTGTDIAIGYMTQIPQFQPGRSIQDEIVLLAGSGLTPLEALQASTLNPALFFKATDSLGTLARGKLADLVLLGGDPLANIQNIHRVQGVIANGRYFDKSQLDSMLANNGPKVDTTTFALTEDLLTRYIALKDDLRPFWQMHADLYAFAAGNAENVNVRVIPRGVDVQGPSIAHVSIFDYVTFAAKDSTLAALFKRHGFQPDQFRPTQIAAFKSVVGAEVKKNLGANYTTKFGAAAPAPGSVAEKNIKLAEAHRADLRAVGVDFQLDDNGQ